MNTITTNNKRKFIIGGNFKCNGTIDLMNNIINNLNNNELDKNVDVFIAPSYIHLDYCKKKLKKNVKIGAQDCSINFEGAFTGEVSAGMLLDLGIEYVILGHSERRKMGESDLTIAKKVMKALLYNLKVVFCIGENLEEKNTNNTMKVLKKQLLSLINVVGDGFDDIVIAYEPVWAIGTGKSAEPEEINEIHKKIREFLSSFNIDGDKVRIQYGGSVKASNCKELARMDNIDGFLIGGASLKSEFVDCINARL